MIYKKYGRLACMVLVAFLVSIVLSSNALAAAKSPSKAKPLLSSKFTLTSAFKNNTAIPDKYAYGKVNMPLQWNNPPKGAKSFAILMYDLHPVANNWVHWAVINIPSNVVKLNEGVSGKAMPKGSVELKNTFGDLGYGGPEPPEGTGVHKYRIIIYALNIPKVNLTGEATVAGFNQAIKGKVLGWAELTGTYITQ